MIFFWFGLDFNLNNMCYYKLCFCSLLTGTIIGPQHCPFFVTAHKNEYMLYLYVHAWKNNNQTYYMYKHTEFSTDFNCISL